MAHCIIKALNAEDIVKMIMENLHLNEREALKAFYTSKTAETLSDDETGFYGQSPLYIYGEFIREYNNSQ